MRPRHGCEICKPAVASILASLWNEDILEPEHETLQDTNDRFLANMQRGGLYSVVPRVPGGEITPDKLRVIADVAKQVRPVHEDHRRAADRHVRRAGARPARHLGSSWSTPASKAAMPMARPCAP